jgi:hypothetical protein
MRIGVKPGQWGWTFDQLLARWSRAEEAGFDLISCITERDPDVISRLATAVRSR